MSKTKASKVPKAIIEANIQSTAKDGCKLDRLLNLINARLFIDAAYKNNETLFGAPYMNRAAAIDALESIGIKEVHNAPFIHVAQDAKIDFDYIFCKLDEAQETLLNITVDKHPLRKLSKMDIDLNRAGADQYKVLLDGINDGRAFEILTETRGANFVSYLNKNQIPFDDYFIVNDGCSTKMRQMFVIHHKQDADRLIRQGMIATGGKAKAIANKKIPTKVELIGSALYLNDKLVVNDTIYDSFNYRNRDKKKAEDIIKRILGGDQLSIKCVDDTKSHISIKSQKVVDSITSSMRNNPKFSQQLFRLLLDNNDQSRKTISNLDSTDVRISRVKAPCILTANSAPEKRSSLEEKEDAVYIDGYWYFIDLSGIKWHELWVCGGNETFSYIKKSWDIHTGNTRKEVEVNAACFLNKIKYEEWNITAGDLVNSSFSDLIKSIKPKIVVSGSEEIYEANNKYIPEGIEQAK